MTLLNPAESSTSANRSRYATSSQFLGYPVPSLTLSLSLCRSPRTHLNLFGFHVSVDLISLQLKAALDTKKHFISQQTKIKTKRKIRWIRSHSTVLGATNLTTPRSLGTNSRHFETHALLARQSHNFKEKKWSLTIGKVESRIKLLHSSSFPVRPHTTGQLSFTSQNTARRHCTCRIENPGCQDLFWQVNKEEFFRSWWIPERPKHPLMLDACVWEI